MIARRRCTLVASRVSQPVETHRLSVILLGVGQNDRNTQYREVDAPAYLVNMKPHEAWTYPDARFIKTAKSSHAEMGCHLKESNSKQTQQALMKSVKALRLELRDTGKPVNCHTLHHVALIGCIHDSIPRILVHFLRPYIRLSLPYS